MAKDLGFLSFVEQYHIKNFIVYPKTSEKLYKWLKAFYIIAFCYQVLINAVLIFDMSVVPKYAPDDKSLISNTIIATVFLAVGFVLMFFKLSIVSFVFNCLAVGFELTLMLPGLIMTSGVFDPHADFYWQFAIPMVIILATSLWMGIIAWREWHIIRRDTALIKNGLYEKFGEDYVSLTDKQIKEFINTFNPNNG